MVSHVALTTQLVKGPSSTKCLKNTHTHTKKKNCFIVIIIIIIIIIIVIIIIIINCQRFLRAGLPVLTDCMEAFQSGHQDDSQSGPMLIQPNNSSSAFWVSAYPFIAYTLNDPLCPLLGGYMPLCYTLENLPLFRQLLYNTFDYLLSSKG